MRTIGLIGGMSWESTAVYYRIINTLVRDRLGGLSSADILLRSVDFQTIVTLQKGGAWEEAGEYLAGIATSLAQSGASNVVICTNTMHLVADIVASRPGVRLINIIDETASALSAARCFHPLLLATAYTMEHGFYAQRMQRSGMEVRVPDEAGRALVHGIIFEELCRGVVRETSRRKLLDLIAHACAGGADSVILGCTELCMLLDVESLACPGFDSTYIHARAAVDDAMRDEALPPRPDHHVAASMGSAGFQPDTRNACSFSSATLPR